MHIGMIISLVILSPFLIGMVKGLFEKSNYPVNVSVAWNTKPEDRVFENVEREIHPISDPLSVLSEVESSILQPMKYSVSEPSNEMNLAIDELLSEVGHRQDMMSPTNDVEPVIEGEPQINEFLAELYHEESTYDAEPSPSMESFFPAELEQSIDELITVADPLSEMTNQVHDVGPVSDKEIDEYFNELYGKGTSYEAEPSVNIDKYFPVEAEQSVEELVTANEPSSTPVVSELMENASKTVNTHEPEQWVDEVKNQSDLFSNVPDFFLAENGNDEESNHFSEDDVALVIGPAPSNVKKGEEPQAQGSLIDLNPMVKQPRSIIEPVKDFKVDEPMDNIINFPYPYENIPTPLPNAEYQQISKRYGEIVASAITTTPAEGRTNAQDVMIGRILENVTGTVLSYGNYFVQLKGNIPVQLLNKAVLVNGHFITPELFYVTQWTDPETRPISLFNDMEEKKVVSLY